MLGSNIHSENRISIVKIAMKSSKITGYKNRWQFWTDKTLRFPKIPDFWKFEQPWPVFVNTKDFLLIFLVITLFHSPNFKRKILSQKSHFLKTPQLYLCVLWERMSVKPFSIVGGRWNFTCATHWSKVIHRFV